MEELLKFQETLHELLTVEMDKLDQAKTELALDQLCNQSRSYLSRLQTIQNEMQQLNNRSAILKKRALKLQQEKQQQALQQEDALEEQMRRDKHLAPVVIVGKNVKK